MSSFQNKEEASGKLEETTQKNQELERELEDVRFVLQAVQNLELVRVWYYNINIKCNMRKV